MESDIAIGRQGGALFGFAQSRLDPFADQFDLGLRERSVAQRHPLVLVFIRDCVEKDTGGGAPGNQDRAGAASLYGCVVGTEVDASLGLVLAMALHAVLAEDGLDLVVVGDDGAMGRDRGQNQGQIQVPHVSG